jgi:two-component system LytT family sensor kinase
VVAPLVIQERHVGALIALYERDRRLRPDDTRVVGEATALVSAQVELSLVAAQEERLTRAELHALRARISPHFIYNSLAAIASYIHSTPDTARTLLAEFADFTRYAFRGERTYVTIAEELHYVEKYLRLEQARFGDRLAVRVQVDPDVLQTVVPVLSLQPLVENAVKHGVEARAGKRTIETVAIDHDLDVELRVCDDGPGMNTDEAASALSGARGRHRPEQRQPPVAQHIRGRLRARDPEQARSRYDGSDGRATSSGWACARHDRARAERLGGRRRAAAAGRPGPDPARQPARS